MLGQEEEVPEEIKADPKQVKQRHMLHKQLKHTSKIRLKKPDVDLVASYCYNPSMPVGRVIPSPKKTTWSEVVKET